LDHTPQLILCPYCGHTQAQPRDRCRACGGFFDPLSLKATRRHMGPWFIRDRGQPFRPGCSYEVLLRQIRKGRIKPTTIIRGPTTGQFWSVARHVPGVAHLLGYCHACGAHVERETDACGECGEVFFTPRFGDQLGLAPVDRDGADRAAFGDSGPDTAVAGAAGEAPPTVDGGAVSGASSDRPAGSAILAGLRADDSTADLDADDSGAGGDPPDALAWMTSEAGEPDTFETAARPATARRRRRTGRWTGPLIATNLLLFAVATTALVLLLRRPDPTPTLAWGDSTTPQGPAEPADAAAAKTPSTRRAGSSDTAPPRPEASRPSAPSATPGASKGATSETVSPSPAAPSDAASSPDPPAERTADEPAADEPSNIFDFGPIEEQLAGDDPPTDPAGPPGPAVARYERALRLEREGRFDAALEQLTTLRDQTPADARPASLDEAIARVQHKINRAELERFLE